MLTSIDRPGLAIMPTKESNTPFLEKVFDNLINRFDAYLVHGKANTLAGHTAIERVQCWDQKFPPAKDDYDLIVPVKANVSRASWNVDFPPAEVEPDYDPDERTFVHVGVVNRQLVVSGQVDHERLCQMGHRLVDLIFPPDKLGERHIMVCSTGSTNESMLAVTENPYPVRNLIESFGHRNGPNAEIFLVDDCNLPIDKLLALRGYLPNMATFRLRPPPGSIEEVVTSWDSIPDPSAIYDYCERITGTNDQDEVRNAYLTLAIQNSLKSVLEVYLSGGVSLAEEAKFTDILKDRVSFLRQKLNEPPITIEYLLEPGLDAGRIYRSTGTAASFFRLLSVNDPQITRIIESSGIVDVFLDNNDWQSDKSRQIFETIEVDTKYSHWGNLNPEGITDSVAGRKKEMLSLSQSQYPKTN